MKPSISDDIDNSNVGTISSFVVDNWQRPLTMQVRPVKSMRQAPLPDNEFKILSHPAVALAGISSVLIVGENSGGIYLQFWIRNLLAMNTFALLGGLGLLILFFAFTFSPKNKNPFSHALLNVLGILLIQLSLILFLFRLPWENSYQTFTGIPLVTLMFAIICSIAFLVVNTIVLIRQRPFHALV